MAPSQAQMIKRVLLTLAFITVLACTAHAAPPAKVKTSDPKTAEANIRKALQGNTTLDFTDSALQDVIDYIKESHEIEIQVDSKALEEAGVATDTSVTVNLKSVSLKSALKLLLGKLDLTYVIADEVLLITSPDAANQRTELRLHDVGDLLAAKVGIADLVGILELAIPPQPRPAAASSKNAAATEPPNYPSGGPSYPRGAAPVGAGILIQVSRNTSIGHLGPLLIVRAPFSVHEQIDVLLDEIRAKLKPPAKEAKGQHAAEAGEEKTPQEDPFHDEPR